VLNFCPVIQQLFMLTSQTV